MNYKPASTHLPPAFLPQASQALSNLKSCRCGDSGKCNEKVYLKRSANLFPSISEIPSHIKVPGRVGRGGGGLFYAVHPYSRYCSSFSPFPLFPVLFQELFFGRNTSFDLTCEYFEGNTRQEKCNKEQVNKMVKSYSFMYSQLCSQYSQLLAVCLILHVLNCNREKGSSHFLCIL